MNNNKIEAWKEQCQLFPNPTSKNQPGPTLPEICINVRASVNGSSEPWKKEILKQTRNMLKNRTESWDKTHNDKIDKLIFKMCLVTIEIIDKELAERQKTKWNF